MKRIFVTIMVIAFVQIAINAQIYGSSEYYYVPAGVNLTDNTQIYVVYFNGHRLVSTEKSRSFVVNKLSESSSYWLREMKRILENPSNGSKYNSSLSTSAREVYENEWYGSQTSSYDPYSGSWTWNQPVLGKYFKAFSKDKSSMIMWRERKNSSTVQNKTYYKLVSKDELTPASNHDFLYE